MREICALAAVATSLLMAACSQGDPHAEIEALIKDAETAVESRQTGFFRGLLSDDYVDARGNTKDDLINRIRGYFLINTEIEIINRIDEITLHGDDAATAVLHVAMVGRNAGRGLLGLDGDLIRMELELLHDGSDWQVAGADWGRLIQ